MKTREIIVNLETKNIYPHPNNPRKNLGDLSELVESIKKHGVMQNLTVMPITSLTYATDVDKQTPADEISLLSDFHVLIGHRRLAAAKEAGINEVPCKIISQISDKQQLAIMLEENMQRNDLTIYEQAQGFQMMLDLGETIETIEEKTGFSKTTIYHRLNIAKLNQKELQKREADEDFQLNLKDLYALEKVKSIKKRNEILKTARDSRNLQYMANKAATEEKRKDNADKILLALADKKMKENPDIRSWNGKWDIIKEFDLDKDYEKITLKKTNEELYYCINYQRLTIAAKSKKKDSPKEGLSDAEKLKRRNRKTLRDIQEELNSKSQDFIKQILLKKTDWMKEEEIIKEVWSCALDSNIIISQYGLREEIWSLIYGEYKSRWSMTDEEKERIDSVADTYPMAYQLLLFINDDTQIYEDIYGYNTEYKKEAAEKRKRLINLLERFGFSVTDEEESLLDGTHEAYRKE